MNAPVTPGDFKNVIISPSATFCLAFVKLFIHFPVLIYNLVNFMLRSDGSIANAFLQQIFVPGDLKPSASPSGQTVDWLLCDGAAYSRTTYADLFGKIGSVHGDGDGSTTFNVPDLRGRFIVGVGTTTGLLDSGGNAIAGTSYSLGGKGGEEDHVLTVAELAQHKHQMYVDDSASTPRTLDGTLAVLRRTDYSTEQSYTMNRVADGVTTQPSIGPTSKVGDAGSDPLDLPKGGHNNVPPYFAGYWYIKT